MLINLMNLGQFKHWEWKMSYSFSIDSHQWPTHGLTIDNESNRRRRLGQMPIQWPTFGAIPTYAISFGEMPAKLQGATAWSLSIQCHTSCATRNIGRTFPNMRRIFPCKPWTFRARPNLIVWYYLSLNNSISYFSSKAIELSLIDTKQIN